MERYGRYDIGGGMFAFYKNISWIILPTDFLHLTTNNYGINILLLTLFIQVCASL